MPGPADSTYYTTDVHAIHRHMSSKHQLKPQRAKQAKKYTICSLQAFFKEKKQIHYFEVV
jgi:hypothetical protein